ncbi:cobalamin biosynthesis protein [Shewanella waksmanii]|uniref:cobalamin biosynthesis protein CobD/CbiB n=1 Tax=Shewanella waksmanii TaxID=213783 RepID=UPI00373517A0
MIPDFAQQVLNDSGFYKDALVLLIAIILAKAAPLPREAQAFVWFSHLAKQLAQKVNHVQRSSQQQTIAGTLALILIVVPFWLIISFLLDLSAFPWFFDIVLLYICLCDEHFNRVAEEVQHALEDQDNSRAKKILAPWSYRDTHELSSVGIAKATIEKMMATPIYGSVATILFFSVGGTALVLGARMVKQVEYCWPKVNPQYQHFGKASYYLCYLLYFIPTVLWNFTLAIQGGPKAIRLLFQVKPSQYPVNNHLKTCQLFAQILNIELAGPMKLEGKRVAIEKVGNGALPTANDIGKAIKLTRFTTLIWISTLVTIPAIWALLRYFA